MNQAIEPMVTPYEVLEYIYYPRFSYFQNVLKIPQFEENRFKVKLGRQVHQKRIEQNREYVRKKIAAESKLIDVYLAAPQLRLKGRVDEILVMRDGSLSPLDYKFAPFRTKAYQTHIVQIVLYGFLIRACYTAKVTRGYIAYIRGGNNVIEVPMSDENEALARDALTSFFAILDQELQPPRTKYRTRCTDCCYRNICV